MIFKQQRFARTRDLFASESRPLKPTLPSLRKQARRDEPRTPSGTTNSAARTRQRLPSLLLRPHHSSGATHNQSDRSSQSKSQKGGDGPVRQEWVPGQPWKMGELVGSGVAGDIYKGLLLESGRTIAVKRIDHHPTEITEIGILSKLQHRNIIQYYGCQHHPTHHLLFLEYLPQQSLSHLISSYGPLTEPTLKLYLKQLLSALDYLHSLGIVHRDLKASNVLISTDGEVRLSDFGCAAYLPLTGVEFRGSVLWAAPEVLKFGGFTLESEMWSLGCLVLELVTGRGPWGGREWDNEFSAIYEIATKDIKPEIPTGASRQLQDLLAQCFQLEPERRPTCRALLQHSYFN